MEIAFPSKAKNEGSRALAGLLQEAIRAKNGPKACQDGNGVSDPGYPGTEPKTAGDGVAVADRGRWGSL